MASNTTTANTLTLQSESGEMYTLSNTPITFGETTIATSGLVITSSPYDYSLPNYCTWSSSNTKNEELIHITKIGLAGSYENFDIRYNIKDFVDFIDKIIVNNNAVVVLWKDKEKTTAVVQGDDEFDLERGIEICLLKRLLGNGYHKLIKEGMKKYQELEDKKQAEIDAKQVEKFQKEIEEQKRQRAEKQMRNEKTYVISEGIKKALREFAQENSDNPDEDAWSVTITDFLNRCGFKE